MIACCTVQDLYFVPISTRVASGLLGSASRAGQLSGSTLAAALASVYDGAARCAELRNPHAASARVRPAPEEQAAG